MYSKSDWNQVVGKFNGTIFHRYEWGEFLETLLRGKFEGVYGKQGVLPVFQGESLPLADYCGPLGEASTEGVEIFSIKKMGTKSPFCTFRLETRGRDYEDILKKTVHQKHRNMVNRAEREGIQVFKFDADEEHLREYYRLYVGTMLRLRRVPLPYLAFEKLVALFGEEVELYLAEYGGRVIGGLFVFVYNDRMHIWGNASDLKFGNIGVNNALYAFAIKRACEEGIDKVDFGSTEVGSSHHFFKERWGGKEMPIYYLGDKDLGGGGSVLEKIVTAVMRLMPVSCVSFWSKILHKIK